MSTKERRTAKFDETPALADSGFVENLTRHAELKQTELSANREREKVREELEGILVGRHLDEVVYEDASKDEWKVVRTTPDPEFRLDEAMLQVALLTIAKMDGPTIKKVIEKSKKKIVKKPYVTVYAPRVSGKPKQVVSGGQSA